MAESAHRSLGLDLIRAAAVSLVLISHFAEVGGAYNGWRAPGWLTASGTFGVELFFVLSGYLIGGILLRLAAERPSWRAWRVFMLRRWMRTLPLYFLWLAVLALCFPPPGGFADTLWRYATLTQNFWRPMPDSNWFGVSWSLTVEEWFYLAFSAAMLGGAAASRRGWMVWFVILAFIAVPFAGRLLAPGIAWFPVTTGRIATLRLDAIAYGVLLARLAPQTWRHPYLALAAGAGLLALVWAQATVGLVEFWVFIWVKAMPTLPAVCFALMFPAALRLTDARGWLAASVRQVSAQSYSLYLVHLTVLEAMWGPILHHGLPRATAAPLALALSFALSWLLWRGVEQPILRRRPV